jgi:simple sugar transport system ATP-binding protein
MWGALKLTELLKLQGLTKAYPGVIANDHVGFSIAKGEVHALLGENGAGKSTLVKMIYGLTKPDSGTMMLHGAPYMPNSPQAARASGVAMVFQHFSLFEALNVAENVALGMENPPKMNNLARSIREVSHTYGLPLDPHRTVGDLSAGERQRVEIIRCLLQDPKLLIMDEPTSVLTPQEVEILFTTLRKLQSEGTSILYISHKLEEIRRLCDDATILRMGKVVGTCDPKTTTARDMAELMVGETLHIPTREAKESGAELLSVQSIEFAPQSPFGTRLKNLSLSVKSGEILGIGGVAGNGQDELLSVLSGEAKAQSGSVVLEGQDISTLGPNARRALGLLSAPEERLGHAAAPNMSLIENTALTATIRKKLSKNNFINWSKTEKFAQEIIKTFDVRTPSANAAARSLSGGNLQKFVIGREVMQAPKVLVVNQPTWGVDASAAASIRQALLDLAAGGAAVICISQDLDELMDISDHFAALNEGKLSVPRVAKGLTVDEIGLMMGGAETTSDARIADQEVSA